MNNEQPPFSVFFVFGRFHGGRLGECVGDPCIGASALSNELLKSVRVEIMDLAVWLLQLQLMESAMELLGQS